MELSRRRSVKLKAQVDKLQESREGQGWSQHRDRVQLTLSTAPHSHGALRGLHIFLLFVSITGHRGSSVYSEAAVPADGAGVQPA